MNGMLKHFKIVLLSSAYDLSVFVEVLYSLCIANESYRIIVFTVYWE